MARYAGKKLHLGGLVMSTNKFTIHLLWPKFWGFKVKSKKKHAKVLIFNADLGAGSRFGPLCGQNTYIHN